MTRRILIIQGHPDPAPSRFCRALAAAYRDGARAAGHDVAEIDVAALSFPLIRTRTEFHQGDPPADIQNAQEQIRRAEHLVFVFPLWLGTLPALLAAFLEQTFRPKFAAHEAASGRTWQKLLKGRSARLIVTMGMPALVYRWYFGAHGLKGFKRNVLGFAGIGPIRETLIGTADAIDAKRCATWLARIRALGRDGR